jgi:hypothetical protein
VRFQVLAVASTKMRAFWDIAPCSLVEVERRFRSTYDSIIRAMRRQCTSATLYGAISEKAEGLLIYRRLCSMEFLYRLSCDPSRVY